MTGVGIEKKGIHHEGHEQHEGRVSFTPSLRGAQATRQSIRPGVSVDCFAALAMTGVGIEKKGIYHEGHEQHEGKGLNLLRGLRALRGENILFWKAWFLLEWFSGYVALIYRKKRRPMTSIPFSPQSALRSYMKSLPQMRTAPEVKPAVAEANSTARAIPASTGTDGVRGVKVAMNQKSLIDSRTAFAISQGGVIPHPVIEESVRGTAADTTKASITKGHEHILPIKVPVATTDPVKIAEDQPPVKAPPGGIWTPYDPPVVQAPLDGGGFTVSIGPDGTAVCGPGPSGPVYLPPKTEEM